MVFSTVLTISRENKIGKRAIVCWPSKKTLLSIYLLWFYEYFLRGVQGVIADYARPFVLGAGPAKLANMSLYLLTGLLLAGIFLTSENSSNK